MENADLVRRVRSAACLALLAAPVAAQSPSAAPAVPIVSARRTAAPVPPPPVPEETPAPPAASPSAKCPQAPCDAPACRQPWAPPRANPSPNGTFLNAWRQAQVARAEEARFTFFLDEWYAGGTKLGPAGREHLAAVAELLRAAPQPITIAPAAVVPLPDEDIDLACDRAADLDAARRRYLAAALERAGIPAAETLVRTARPLAEGLDGNEAPRVYRGLIGTGGGNAGGGGMGGAGMSGGAAGGGFGGGIPGGR